MKLNPRIEAPVVTAGMAPTETEVAEIFALEWGHQVRWCEGLKSWLVWGVEPGMWVVDDTKTAQKMMTDTVDRQAEIGALMVGRTPAQAAGLRVKMMKKRFIFDCMELAKSVVLPGNKEQDIETLYMAVRLSDFDVDPWEMSCPGGLLDLRTGQLWPHKEGAMFLQRTAVTPTVDSDGFVVWDPEGTPVWVGHLGKLSKGRADMMEYLRRLSGITLVGSQTDVPQVAPQMTGRGRCGKGTFINALRKLLGTYAIEGSTRVLSNSSDVHTTDQADLHNKRLVYLEEVKRVAAESFNRLTGGGQHRARGIGVNNQASERSWSLWINNNGPMLWDNPSVGTWNRCPKLDFGDPIPEEEQIADFHQWLVSEYPGILSWAVQGLQEYLSDCQKQGVDALATPESVRADSQVAKRDAEPLVEFLNLHYYERDIGGRVLGSNFLKSYTAYCKDTGETAPGGARAVNDQLRNLGIVVEMDSRRRTFIHGIAEKVPYIPGL